MESSKNPNKRDKFTQPKKKNTTFLVFTGIAGVLLVVGAFFIFSNGNSSNKVNRLITSKAIATIGQKVTYNANEDLQQTKVQNKVANGKVTVTSLTELKEKKFIWTEYNANGNRVPLTAFAEPNGKVVVAVSMCEPCNSDSFRINGDTLICNKCGTTWYLKNLFGIQGACTAYPPQVIEYTQNGDKLEVDQALLDAWKPRV